GSNSAGECCGRLLGLTRYTRRYWRHTRRRRGERAAVGFNRLLQPIQASAIFRADKAVEHEGLPSLQRARSRIIAEAPGDLAARARWSDFEAARSFEIVEIGCEFDAAIEVAVANLQVARTDRGLLARPLDQCALALLRTAIGDGQLRIAQLPRRPISKAVQVVDIGKDGRFRRIDHYGPGDGDMCRQPDSDRSQNRNETDKPKDQPHQWTHHPASSFAARSAIVS